MKKLMFTLLLIILASQAYAQSPGMPQTQNGDIIFQCLEGGQNYAIYLISGSPYTHCGLIVEKNDGPYVYEAVGPVMLTPLKDWIKRGINQHYVLMRLKNAHDVLTPKALAAMQKDCETFSGKPYDFWFLWSNDNIYCSELVWKIYEQSFGLELAPLRPFRDFKNVDHAEVQRIAKERFVVIPWDEPAVSPADLMASPLLETVAAN